MHLTSKQITSLIIPFLLSLGVYFFDIDIVQNIKYLFPNYEEYTNKTLDKKATIYLKIESKNKLYQSITQSIKERKKNATWVVDTVLYKKVPIEKSYKVARDKKIVQKSINVGDYKLEAVFSKDKIAIINGKLVKENSYIGDIKVLKVEEFKVLLEYKKGKKWVYLFQ